MSVNLKEKIQQGLQELEICHVTEEQLAQLEQFVAMLLEKNKVMNLTAITEPNEVITRHLLDSAALLPFLPEVDSTHTLIDIGTGAGFPGIPLKILRPDLEVTLMDALEKRLLWLEEVSDHLELDRVATLHGRGEELPHESQFREQFHLATSRAVADMGILAELSLPFVKVGGLFLAMKSTESEQEIRNAEGAIAVLGGKIRKVVEYQIPFTGISQRVVVIEKVKETPDKYPRRWAKMKNTPIVI